MSTIEQKTLGFPVLTLVVPRRLRQSLRDPSALYGLTIVTIADLMALFAPLLPLQEPTDLDLKNRLLPISADHPLGTDHLGRDELSRLVYGARTTLGLAGLSLIIIMSIALLIGAISGYYGGWLDTWLMAVVDLLLAFPSLILGIAVAGILGPSIVNV